MIKYLLLIFFSFGLTAFDAISQNTEKLNLIQTSAGFKNSFGAISIAYNRRVIKENFGIEFRLGCGINNSFVYGTGFSIRHFSNKKIEILSSLDFIGNAKGIISYDDEGYSDKYAFSEYYYLSPHINGRFYFNEQVSLELKIGYSYRLNQVSIVHIQGNMDKLNNVNRTINSGLLIGLGLNFGW